MHLLHFVGYREIIDDFFPGLFLGLVDRLHHPLHAFLKLVVVGVGGHLIVFAQVHAAHGGFKDLIRRLLRGHPHFRFDDVEGERPVLDTEEIPHAIDPELRSLEVFDHVFRKHYVEKTDVLRIGKAVARDRKQRHGNVIVPGSDRERQLNHARLGVRLVGGYLVIAYHFSRQRQAQVLGVFVGLLPASRRPFDGHCFHQLEVVDEVDPGQGILHIIGGNDVIFHIDRIDRVLEDNGIMNALHLMLLCFA